MLWARSDLISAFSPRKPPLADPRSRAAAATRHCLANVYFVQRRLDALLPLRSRMLFRASTSGRLGWLESSRHSLIRQNECTHQPARSLLERFMRHELAACVMRGYAQLLLARACNLCDESLSQRLADLTAQADVDACDGLHSVFRMHAGASIQPETRVYAARGPSMSEPAGRIASGLAVLRCAQGQGGAST